MKRFARLASLVFVLFALLVSYASASAARLDRAFVIYMENEGFDDVIGHDDASGRPDTPFITNLAIHYGLETFYFGVTHPSLPNYLAFTGGSTYNISDDNPSCYAVPAPGAGCHAITTTNVVDELEAAHISWAAFEQSMPSVGFLGARYPLTGPTLYAQKHNPFVYYRDIATNPARLNHIRPLDDGAMQLRLALANPFTAPRLLFIVPDQCHDMHGTSTCTNTDALLRTSDAYLARLVDTITHSPSYTGNSAIFIVWDENDYTSNLACCLGSPPIGGGHVAAIVLTPHYTHPLHTADPANHYALLRTVETGFGLAPLGNAALEQPVFFQLLP